MKGNRDDQGRFLPGQTGNPKGRPLSSGFSALLRSLSKTGDLRELGEFAYAVLRADVEALKPLLPERFVDMVDELSLLKAAIPKMVDRVEALKWISERALGKAPALLAEDNPYIGMTDEEVIGVLLDSVPDGVLLRALKQSKAAKLLPLAEAH